MEAVKNITKSPNQRQLGDASDLAKDFMKKYGLSSWTFDFDRSKRRAGRCSYTKKKISLSMYYALKVPTEELKNTILHEIAHALVGPGHNHDEVWRRTAIGIGCDGNRCHSFEFTEGKVTQFCTAGCWSRNLHKRPKDGKICKKCKSPVKWTRK
jgi:predicted SprT family Zn-dependent metalloprotease